MIPIQILNNTKKIHFVGIGGIGMSGLAEYYLNKGYTVTGSDTTESNITRRLKKLGAIVSIGHTAENVNNFLDTLVYSSAVGQDNPELLRAHELHIRPRKIE